MTERTELDRDATVGDILKRSRLYFGQTLEDVERVLHIRAVQLDALEKGEIHRLPGRVYAIGFVRSYAEYLGLDGDRMVELFKTQAVGGDNRPELHFPAPASESRMPGLVLVLGSLVTLGIAYAGWATYRSDSEAPPAAIQPVSSALKKELEKASAPPTPAPIRTGEKFGPPAPDKTAQDDLPGTPRVLLRARSATWMEIRSASGRALFSGILKEGESYVVPEAEGLTLTAGNAGGLTIELKGHQLSDLGEKGQVLRNIPLDPVTLKSRFGR